MTSVNFLPLLQISDAGKRRWQHHAYRALEECKANDRYCDFDCCNNAGYIACINIWHYTQKN